MKISEAQKYVTKQRIIAAGVTVLNMLFFACATLKTIYYSLNGDTTPLHSLSLGGQHLIYAIYQKTQFAGWCWEWAPIINPKVWNTLGNFGFFFIALVLGIGRTMWDSANHLSARIRNTIKKVEELGWQQELLKQTEPTKNIKIDALQINMDLNQKDQWYKRPIGLILIGVSIAVLAQLANLELGLVK